MTDVHVLIEALGGDIQAEDMHACFTRMASTISTVEANELQLSGPKAFMVSAETTELSKRTEELRSHMSTMLGLFKSVLGSFSQSQKWASFVHLKEHPYARLLIDSAESAWENFTRPIPIPFIEDLWCTLILLAAAWLLVGSIKLCFKSFFRFFIEPRYKYTTITWTKWPSLVVLWGVSWMLYPPPIGGIPVKHDGDTDSVGSGPEEDWSSWKIGASLPLFNDGDWPGGDWPPGDQSADDYDDESMSPKSEHEQDLLIPSDSLSA